MNFTITLNGEGPELANALRALKGLTEGQALSGEVSATITAPQTPQHEAPVYQQQNQAAQAFTPQPQQQPIYQEQQQPPVYQQQNQAAQQQQFEPQQQQQHGVPVSTQAYSMDQLSVAATQLMDAGRQQELLGLLSQFGIPALTMLPKEHYGNFATALRGMGAKI